MRKKTWNVYSIERRKTGRVVTKFIGEIESEAKARKRAAAEVEKKAGVVLEVRDAATDNWRRPG